MANQKLASKHHFLFLVEKYFLPKDKFLVHFDYMFSCKHGSLELSTVYIFQ